MKIFKIPENGIKSHALYYFFFFLKRENVQIFIARRVKAFSFNEWNVKCNQTLLDEGINGGNVMRYSSSV